jgi:predicted glycogen debranching enzyme
MTLPINDHSEWLEPDGLGGFASGTTSGVRTRRYHALVLTATTPPTGRMVLVNGFDAWVDTPAGSFALTTQRYAPDVHHPDGSSRIVSFVADPWPTWELATPGGVRLLQEVFVEHGSGVTVVAWTLIAADSPIVLRVRPFISGRDYHAMQHENGAFRFDAEQRGSMVAFRPYDGLPAAVSFTNGDYRQAPDWYRQFLYDAERDRGLDAVEDLGSPGEFSWPLATAGDRAVWQLSAMTDIPSETRSREDTLALHDVIRAAESKRRGAFASPLERSADAYLVRRGRGRTIVAGYPWFTDWGRDTFIAVRGLCLATGRLDDARDILVEWAGAVSEGMLPNRFPDHGEAPEFNSVDASLWYVIAAGELLDASRRRPKVLSQSDRSALEAAIVAIVAGYAAGTRFGIRMDSDGLLAAGVAGVQLTWMDARVGDRVITPRIGKPVEIQALWLNALSIAARFDRKWREPLANALAAFNERFWIEEEGYLADVVDVDHMLGTRDARFRPNQILAVGGLPLALVTGEKARRVVEGVERRLVTPIGLRSLAPAEDGYAARYEGDSAARDAIYHQGTVWPWLMGAFVDAWLTSRGRTIAARAEARRRFVEPLLSHLQVAGLGHVSEIADAEEPFGLRGCPFQAWSLGELIRIERVILPSRGSRVPRRKRETVSV